MLKKLSLTCLNVKREIRSLKSKFMNDERGVSPVVATVLIILITVILALFLSKELQNWISDLIGRFTSRTKNL